MRLSDETKAEWVDVLAAIYGRVDWGKWSSRHGPWDVWNHRVRCVVDRPTLGEACSRLANQFGLQHLQPETVESIATLEPHAEALLDWTAREHIPVAMRAVMRAKELKGAKGKPCQESLVL